MKPNFNIPADAQPVPDAPDYKWKSWPENGRVAYQVWGEDLEKCQALAMNLAALNSPVGARIDLSPEGSGTNAD